MRFDRGDTRKLTVESVCAASGGNASACGPGSTRSRARPLDGSIMPLAPTWASAWRRRQNRQPIAGDERAALDAAHRAHEVRGAAPEHDRRLQPTRHGQVGPRTDAAPAELQTRTRGHVEQQARTEPFARRT